MHGIHTDTASPPIAKIVLYVVSADGCIKYQTAHGMHPHSMCKQHDTTSQHAILQVWIPCSLLISMLRLFGRHTRVPPFNRAFFERLEAKHRHHSNDRLGLL